MKNPNPTIRINGGETFCRTSDTLMLTIDCLTYTWQGGRLADIAYTHDPQAFDCIEVPGYSWETGESTGTANNFITACREHFDEWMRDRENQQMSSYEEAA